ncbi:MAG TPA: acyl-CoA dehydrogenase family protein, partial [Pseudomonadales bacterium]|nr:acyl-CoA dehydrogenase family protein [Pseudomonadales bacterium]
MALALNDEQRFLKQTAAEFFAQQAPIAQLRQLRDQHSADGFDRATWQEMVELGWSGILIPERFGGSDFGFLGLALVLEESGRTLAATPLPEGIDPALVIDFDYYADHRYRQPGGIPQAMADLRDLAPDLFWS